MADFPDTYETKTTTTTSSSTTVCSYNEAYLNSVPGMLRIGQIVVGLIYWIFIVATACHRFGGYLLPITIIAWILTIILFCLFLFMIAERITIINWPLTEFINNIIWGIFHAIGVILVMVTLFSSNYYWHCRYFGNWAQLFLSIGITLLYLFHAFILFKNGVIVIRSQSSGATVQT